jgi:hypothetical protein
MSAIPDGHTPSAMFNLQANCPTPERPAISAGIRKPMPAASIAVRN